ncbi:ester cyclase [Devosia sediminis]|uniref:Ester cyclase n=1 Tax=Devosia sediminis TaxID=2798801 RepID=A0A934IM46_9HYPH|nr:ester cyclase [Devosia sediminis]MBJ3783279.1 ester cyclase [Devosia sediminis]
MDRAQANIDIMTAAFAALNRHDLDACTAMMTPDFAIHIAGTPMVQTGPAAWRRNTETLLKAFPDAKVEVLDMFADADKVAVRLRMTGTHRGAFLGLEPSDKAINYDSNELYQITDGKIAAEWICSDMLTLMSQIGGYPAGHLAGLWISSFKVWIAAGLGLVLGAGIMALL